MTHQFFIASLVLISVLDVCTVSAQQRLGNPPNNTDKSQRVPVQNYAVIDISGDTATSPVTLVALNDDNQAAFGFFVGTDPLAIYAEYDTYTWKDGTLGAKQVSELLADVKLENHAIGYTIRQIFGLLSGGNVWGRQFTEWYDDTYGSWIGIKNEKGFFGGRTVDLPSPFITTDSNMPNDEHWSSVGYVSEKGVIAGVAWALVATTPSEDGFTTGFCYEFDPHGKLLIFDGHSDYSKANTFNSSTKLIAADGGAPTFVNNNGWIVADTWNVAGSTLWKGIAPWQSFNDDPCAINDQNQVVVLGRNSHEGYLWENGTLTVLAKKPCLPKALEGQLKNIQPSWISNQVTPGAGANADATIHILATAKDNGKNVTVVCTRDKAGKWNVAEIQLPSGVSISSCTSINSSGVIAAIGNAGTGDSHALLLIPAQILRDNKPISLDNKTVCVGQQMNLTASVSGFPSTAISSYKWTIPGTVFKDYQPTTFDSNYKQIYYDDLNKQDCHFYWSDGAVNRTVSCALRIYGLTASLNAKLDVARPNARIFEKNGFIAADTNYKDSQPLYTPQTDGLPYLHFGTAIGSNGGANFSQKIAEPNGFSGGITTWVQIINSDTYTIKTSTSTDYEISTGGLDEVFPYDTKAKTADSPAVKLGIDSVSVYRNFNATMYLLWRPSKKSVHGDNTVWVPLRGFQWNWSGTATNASPVNNGTGWSVHDPMYPSNNSDADVTEEVKWLTFAVWLKQP